jgi:phosphoribosylformimino-5-aminoimidazole carboxamide ribotide isomerase
MGEIPAMIVYPAIDIRGGRAVRLVQGDYQAETQFDADPADAARRWAEAGAEWIHVVDLDAAKSGVRGNADAIAAVRSAVDVPVQLGGGFRSLDDINAARAIGIDRVIIGSIAITNPEVVETAVREFGDAIAVGLDARNGMLAGNGWIDQSDVVAIDAARRFANAGVRTFIYTDILRDGTFTGPNLDALSDLIAAVDANVIASGGIGALDDVSAVRDTGAHGVIIGSALYHRKFDLADAISTANKVAAS